MISSLLPLRKLILVAGDLVAFTASIATGLVLRHGALPEANIVTLYLFATPFLCALWAGGLLVFGLYDLRGAKNEPAYFERLAKALAFNLLATVFLFYFVGEIFRLSPILTLLIIFAAQILALGLWRAAFNALSARARRERVLFIGASGEVLEVAAYLSANPQIGFDPVLIIDEAEETIRQPAEGVPVRAIAESDLPATIRTERVSHVVILPSIKTNTEIVKIIVAAIPLGITVSDFPKFSEAITGKIPVSRLGEVWFLENLIGQRRPRYEFLKRILDLTVAALGGIVWLALLPFIALAIVLSTPRDILAYKKRRAHQGDGIVFFRQKRVGRGGLTFGFLKFRSQRLGAEKLGWSKAEGPDPRAYPFGTFLRRAYLDELPQVWNVVKGEMSFVGPRPERPAFVQELARTIPYYRMREMVLPGITGWAQINMAYDASVEDAQEKIQYDLYYIKNRSIALDLLILAKTAFKLLQRSGR